MFVYLSKKLAVGSVKVTTVAWSTEHNCIAVGADDGIIRMISNDGPNRNHKGLTVKQQLSGHTTPVTGCKWNELHQKLTTSDASGLIIVWVSRKKDEYYEEMVNNRGKAFAVTGLDWSPDGTMIAILYEDGNMIIGSVEGTRLWEKEFKVMCRNVQWNPDSKVLLVGVGDEVQAFDENGKLTSSVSLSSASFVVCVKWCCRQTDRHRCSLALAFSDGSVQFMRNESDPSPLLCDTGLKITCMEWSTHGRVLAVAGKNRADRESKSIGVTFLMQEQESIQCVQNMRMPGRDVSSLSWQRDDLCLALGVDSYVYFATIRQDYKWAFFESIVVYVLSPDVTAENGESVSVVFWNTKTDERCKRQVRKVIAIAACQSYCLLATDTDSGHQLMLCNTRGVPVQQRELEVGLKDVAMTSSLVIAISSNSFVVWRYAGVDAANPMDEDSENEDLRLVSVPSADTINCISCSEKLMVLALSSGTCLVYKLPAINQVESFVLKFNDSPPICPAKVFVSSDGQRLAIMDSGSRLVIHDMETNSLLGFEKKDVWSFKWCSDQPAYFAVTEKNKMMTYKDMECEESAPASGYIACFSDLNITTIQLDQLVNEYEDYGEEDLLVTTTETKTMRDLKNLLKKEGFRKAGALAETSPHPRLWRLMADHAMRQLDFASAEDALVRCKDYQGIQFCKSLAKLPTEGMKKAGVHAYFGELDEAERIYLDVDRKDMAIQLRKTMGQYEHVLALISDGSGMTNDTEIKETMRLIGDQYADRMQYMDAVKFYERCDSFASLFQSYLRLEDYDALTKLMTRFSPAKDELLSAALTFESVGMCDEAVDAYLRAGEVREAIRCCVSLNSWQTALTLAQQHEISDTDLLLSQYAAHLLQKEKYFDIVELYKKAGRLHDASSMILKVIEDLKRNSRIVSVRLFKQLHCLIGILHSESEEKKQRRSTGQRRNTLTSLLREDESLVSAAVNFRAFDSPWKGCEAYHFYLLAHKHLYGSTSSTTGSSIDDAMKCALHLRDYEEFLYPEDIYALIALTACGNRNFVLASQAFMKLETMSDISDQKKKQYMHLATDIFTRHPPKESRNIPKHECSSCEMLIPDYLTVCSSCNTRFPTCVATGRPIVSPDEEWTCNRCHHVALKSEIMMFNNCPLCHFQIGT